MEQIEFFYPELISKRLEFGTIYTLRFTQPENFSYKAGQWVHLGVNTATPDKSMVRHMSFSSSPDDGYLEFTMDLGSGSAYKEALAALKPGDKVKAFKIRGEFFVNPEEKREVLFLCGGLGITPIKSNIRKLEQLKTTVDWTLVHVARGEHLFKEELSKCSGKQYRIHRSELEDVWNQIVDEPKNKLFYVCGSSRFLEGMIERLIGSGIAEDQIRTENFK